MTGGVCQKYAENLVLTGRVVVYGEDGSKRDAAGTIRRLTPIPGGNAPPILSIITCLALSLGAHPKWVV